MRTAILLCLALAAAAEAVAGEPPIDGGPRGDPEVLLARLGSPRFREREEAAEAIRSLGGEALGVLRSARRSEDPEVRARAEVLLDDLEWRRLLQPLTVKLDGGSRPAGRVARDLMDQAGVPLELEPGDDPRWPDRPIDLGGPVERPFWEALDRLGLDLRVAARDEFGRFPVQAGPTLRLAPRGPEPAPAWVDGPFRLVAREPVLLGRFRAMGDAAGGRGEVELPTVQLNLELTVEPRLGIAPAGAPRITRAVDERGRSLLPEDEEMPALALSSAQPRPTPRLEYAAYLPRDARRPGRIARIEGIIPVTVEGRRSEPIESPLPRPGDGPASLDLGGAELTVLSVARSPFRDSWEVELLYVPAGWQELLMFRRNRRRLDSTITSFDLVPGRLEFADAEGRPLPPARTREQRPQPEGIRVVLEVPALPDSGRPDRLLYRGSISRSVELSFALEGVRLPDPVSR